MKMSISLLLSSLIVALIVVVVTTFSEITPLTFASSPPSSAFNPTFEVVEKQTAKTYPRWSSLESQVDYDPVEQMAYYFTGSAFCRYSLNDRDFSPQYCAPVLDFRTIAINESLAQNRLLCVYTTSSFNTTWPCNPPTFTSSIVDSATNRVYSGKHSNSKQRIVCMYQLPNSPSVTVSDLSLLSCNVTGPVTTARSYYSFQTAFISQGYGFFSSSDGEVCEYSLQSLVRNFSFVKCINTFTAASLNNAIVDSSSQSAYYPFSGSSGTTNWPKNQFFSICKFALRPAFEFVTCLSMPIDVDQKIVITTPALNGVFFDESMKFAYFAISQSNMILRYNLSPGNFSFDSSIQLPIVPYNAFLDSTTRVAYISSSVPFEICELNLTTGFSTSSLTCREPNPVPKNEDGAVNFNSAIYDDERKAAYFGGKAVCKYDTSGEKLELIECLQPPVLNVNIDFYAAVFDRHAGRAFFGGEASFFDTRLRFLPTAIGRFCAFDLKNFSFSSCVQVTYIGGVMRALRFDSSYYGILDSERSLAVFAASNWIEVFAVSSEGHLRHLQQYTVYQLNHLIRQNSLRAAVYDSLNGILYASAFTDGGYSYVTVCAFPISASSPYMGSVDCIQIGTSNSYRAGGLVALLDQTNMFVYVSEGYTREKLCRVNVALGNFVALSCAGPSSDGRQTYTSGSADFEKNAAFVVSNTRLDKYDISRQSFRFLSSIQLTSSNENVYANIIDPSRNLMFLGMPLLGTPGSIYKVSLNTFTCTSSTVIINQQQQLRPGPLRIIGANNCHLSFADVSIDEKIAFISTSPVSNAELSFDNVVFRGSAPEARVSFYQDLNNVNLTLTNITQGSQSLLLTSSEVSSSPLVYFSPTTSIASSNINFVNNTLTNGQSSFISFSSSSSLDAETNFSFTTNTIPSTSPSSIANFESTPFDLGSSQWNFACDNDWMNGFLYQFQSQVINSRISRCRTASPTVSATLSESVFCLNLNQQQCTEVGTGNCHFCVNRNLCVPREQDCSCSPFHESVCPFAVGCKFCSDADVCVDESVNCTCFVFDESSCKVASACRWCSNFNSCLTLPETCYCSTLSATTCSTLTQNECTFCPEQEVCLPTADFNKDTCSCLNMNSSNCQTSRCSWCDNYQTCGFPSWNCDCTSFSNSSSLCAINSNNHCKLCEEETVCVDAQKVNCRCENFTESVCGSSSCKWCSDLNSCTVPENTNCSCHLLRDRGPCDDHAGNKCQFCSTLGSCLPKEQTCSCAALQSDTCSLWTNNNCTYCPEQKICLPTIEVNQNTCSCLKMNSSNCQQSTCSWCSNYETCGLPSWDCDCISLISNSSSSCAVNSNNHCKLCQNESVCVDARNFTCRCENFTETVCDSSSCRWCDTLSSCTVPENDQCNCYLLRGQQSCDHNSNGMCHFCSNFDSCLPLNEKCYCSTLSQYACTSQSDGKCTYCLEQEICIPTTDFNKDTCSCLNMNSSNCQQSTCSWCDDYETCGLPNWDCDCTSLSNSSASACSTNSNNHCKLCQEESVCVDVQNFTCRCENFTQSVCGSSSCNWCEHLNSCTVPENVNCTCNWLRFEDSCNRHSNNKCSWCATSSDTGNNGYYEIKNFDYCINNDGEDQCQCSYLSPSFCSFANDPILNEIDNFSTACRYCAISDVCAHPANKNCDCGNFATAHSCGVASLCSWKEPVLTFDGATQYCSAASVTCSPVTCAGILSKASCESAGCGWNPQSLRCDSKSACFNFFVGGFTPQPMMLWIIGLFKDVLVVFLVGAFANIFTRPIMKFISAVKKQVLKQTHIKQRTMEETVYMSDKFCRDDVNISFPRYVELVCESVFQLENDDLLDEDNRLVLFDAVAFTLFDNMIWVDIDLLEGNIKQEEVNYSKRFGLGSGEEPSQHEMRDLTVDETDVKNEDEDDQKEDDPEKSSIDADHSQSEIEGDTFLEQFTAKIITSMSGLVKTVDADVNTRGQMLGQFIAAATTQYDTYLKTKNVDLLKIKVLLTAQDFESAVTLRKKVDDCLLERASAYVFYDQSRDRKVCAATSANTFPPALNLVYYSVALVFLFITSFITVRFYPNITRMVKSCNVVASANISTNSSSDNTTNSSSAGDDGPTSEFTLNSSNLTGAYFLLGFRLLNSSAFSTAILVFVKVIRGVYQRYSGIYTLSLQERIPLMALYSDRFIHVMLFLYALLVLPFALCGPTYGSSFGVYCWVPIFIAAAILIGDAIVLYVSRRITAIKNRLLNKKDESEDDEKQKALSKTFADLNQDFEDFLDSPSVSRMKLQDGVTRIPSAKADQQEEEKTQQSEAKEDDQETNALSENLLSPREGDEDEDAESSNNKPKGEETNNTEEETKLDEEVIKNQSSIESLSPVDLWNAILVFIMTEEIPVIVISLALQLSFNYAALLHYGDAFGLSIDKGNVYGRDYDSRSVECLVSVFENDVSSFVSGLSSFVPFM